MCIRVVLAFSNMLFSKGIEKILSEAPGIEVVKTLRPQWALDYDVEPDIILADLISLYNYIDDKYLSALFNKKVIEEAEGRRREEDRD